jgi:hypothetical protein
MIFMRKMNEVSIFNPIEVLGIIPSSDMEEEECGNSIKFSGFFLHITNFRLESAVAHVYIN